MTGITSYSERVTCVTTLFPKTKQCLLGEIMSRVDCDGFSTRSGEYIYDGRRRWQASGGRHYAGTELASHARIMHDGPNERHRSPNFASSPWPSLTTCSTSSAKTKRSRILSLSLSPHVWASCAGQYVGKPQASSAASLQCLQYPTDFHTTAKSKATYDACASR